MVLLCSPVLQLQPPHWGGEEGDSECEQGSGEEVSARGSLLCCMSCHTPLPSSVLFYHYCHSPLSHPLPSSLPPSLPHPSFCQVFPSTEGEGSTHSGYLGGDTGGRCVCVWVGDACVCVKWEFLLLLQLTV